jgi:hypothetical protein
MSPQACCVGIHVAQAALDIGVHPSAVTWQVANDDPGITTLVPRLRATLPGSYGCRTMSFLLDCLSGSI